jgi:hypothetical protein
MVNVMFFAKEIEYLKSQHIARIATAAVGLGSQMNQLQ